jgi:hypothetical protein
MARVPKGTLVTLGPERRPFQCLVCGGKLFRDKDVKVDTHFVSTPATGLACMACGYLHIFMDGGTIDMWRPDLGYPS